ncbi:TRAP transporter small permease subunit [Devosia sp. XJ19-1]|uniref:TRAP transporter small permease protein n=1 Tax=Devosia ureilytica TaxID=2952754 RepID=A0A9Q4AQ10_9HYPH|nr:TRAP transporter small permease subunit [Devosia ureilytica]MCP8884127.1 TRAP transporter small permease subunit [Devosia ureilytica]MCP8887735.1 TRAP transporter small permease subunit [Devosia ureilytica]
MPTSLVRIGTWLHARAENLLALMLGIMFTVFILQIVFRYLLNFPIGWTHEVSVIMWIWMVLFGSAFVVRDSEEIRFDILYGAARGRLRRAMVATTGLIFVALFSISLPAVVDYITFMKVEKTAYLDIRFDYLYSIYGIFALAMIVRQLWLTGRAVWGKDEESFDPTRSGSGV